MESATATATATANGTTPATSPPPTRVIILSVPRTTSNLLMRLFSQSSKVDQLDYPFMWGTMWGPDRFWVPPRCLPAPVLEAQLEKHKEMGLQWMLDRMQEFVKTCEEQGKVAMIKEHTQNTIDPHLNVTIPDYESIPSPNLEDKALDLPPSTTTTTTTSTHAPPPELDKSNKSNISYIPTRFLLTFSPTFIIRHPARVVASFKRASDSIGLEPDEPSFKTMLDYRFSRAMFDWYRSLEGNNGKKVLMIDADDLVGDPKGVMGRWCEEMGYEEGDMVKYSWEKKTDFESPLHAAFLGTVYGSEGVIKDEKVQKPIDMEVEFKAWVEEFGEKNASGMRDIVEKNMEDYEYLKAFKL